jgi:hypothetical protein
VSIGHQNCFLVLTCCCCSRCCRSASACERRASSAAASSSAAAAAAAAARAISAACRCCCNCNKQWVKSMRDQADGIASQSRAATANNSHPPSSAAFLAHALAWRRPTGATAGEQQPLAHLRAWQRGRMRRACGLWMRGWGCRQRA